MRLFNIIFGSNWNRFSLSTVNIVEKCPFILHEATACSYTVWPADGGVTQNDVTAQVLAN